MATTNLTFDELRRWLEERAQKLQGLSFRRPLRTVAFYLASRARACFDGSHDPGGTPWLPLKNPSQRRGGASAKPLRDTGLLMASLTGQGGGHVEDISDVALVWGTNVKYAGYHQSGTRHIPARPFLGITARDEDRIVKIIVEYVEKTFLTK